GQRCGRGPPRYSAEPGQSFLWTRRAGYPVDRGESFWAELGAPVLHHRVTHGRDAGDRDRHQNARTYGSRTIRARGSRTGAGTSAIVPTWILCFSLHHLRSRDVELVAASPDRTG